MWVGAAQGTFYGGTEQKWSPFLGRLVSEAEYGVKTKVIVADFSKGKKVYEHIEEELRDIPVGILGTYRPMITYYLVQSTARAASTHNYKLITICRVYECAPFRILFFFYSEQRWNEFPVSDVRDGVAASRLVGYFKY